MKNIQKTAGKIQNFYNSRFVSVIFAVVAVEIYILVMVILGGAR